MPTREARGARPLSKVQGAGQEQGRGHGQSFHRASLSGGGVECTPGSGPRQVQQETFPRAGTRS